MKKFLQRWPFALHQTLGVFAVLASSSTWVMDVLGLVYRCPYCQVQRTAIGIIGILLLLPHVNKFTRYLTLLVGFFGANVAATQVFNNIYKSAYHEAFIYLAACALIILIAEMYVMFLRPDDTRRRK